ncbi:MAG: hypothetical protein ACKO38_01820 [Planctomycetota bacterium]
MPNHFPFLLWPVGDDDFSTFMQRLTNTHAQRWQHHRHRVGHGHVYQGRFKLAILGAGQDLAAGPAAVLRPWLV